MIRSFKSWKPFVDECCFVAPNCTIIGNVEGKNNSSIWYGSVLRADLAKITIGEGTNIQELCSLHVKENGPVFIGDYVTVGHGVILHGCSIGNNSLIGMGSIILDDARIGNNSLVGAGSLVTEGKTFPDGSLLLGSPAKKVRDLTQEEIQNIKQSAQHYIQLAIDNKKAVEGVYNE
ncbi:MAG: gamma carbonic anhydrase family protein [Caldisericia bacterium]|nr:gamma carbonic anhydrase family protein [Caldisericia bacterium]MDD4614278.1 gamma carbonic anhydrase family protein [Caldisericia bacterium]